MNIISQALQFFKSLIHDLTSSTLLEGDYYDSVD